MSRPLVFVVIALFLVWPVGQVRAEAYLTMDDYRQLEASQQRAWIAGLVDGILLLSQGNNLSGRRWLLDCIRARTLDQLHQDFARYAEGNSSFDAYAAAGEFALAMNERCPRTPF